IVEPEDFEIATENGHSTISCLEEAAAPTGQIPVVINGCGAVINHGEPVIDTFMTGCEGAVQYTYTFTDCAGHSHDWIYTYHIVLPELDVPEPDTAIIQCPGEATEPEPGTLTDACGREVLPVANAGNPVTDMSSNGTGTVTYGYTYTDCMGNTYPWQFVYTVEPEPFVPVADADDVIHCLDAAVEPQTPEVTVCDAPVAFVLSDSSFVDNGSCGDYVYTYQYTVNGTDYTWTYTYHIVPEDFAIAEADGSAVVSCVESAIIETITPPEVTDACGNPITPAGPETDASNFNGCEGDIVYTYTYTDCAGNSRGWTFTYHIQLPETIEGVPADGTATVSCLADVHAPETQNISDICGNEIAPVYVDSTASLNPDGTGSVVFSYIYSDCAGHDSVWTFTYQIVPGEFTPADDGTAVVHCVSEVVAPQIPEITNCGESIPIIFDHASTTLADGCGDSVLHYTYIVNDSTYTWTYTYHVVPEDFTVPTDSIVHVQCISEVSKPNPPAVVNACQTVITPLEQTVDSLFNGCSGHVTYTWRYEDCAQNVHDWSCTFFIADTTAPTFNAPNHTSICRSVDGSFDADTLITGYINNLNDNCLSADLLTVAFSDTTQNDTIVRTWTVSDLCQSTSQIQYIILLPAHYITFADSICEGDTYEDHGFDTTITTAGEYLITNYDTNIYGCDSITVLQLTVHAPTDTVLTPTINQNSLPYTLNDIEYDSAGTYIQHVLNSFGCDSTITLILTVNDNVTVNLDTVVCENELPIVWNSVEFVEPGDSTIIIPASSGADSIITMHLSVAPTYQTTIDTSICYGYSYHFNGQIYNATGEYWDTAYFSTSEYGCDSIITLHLIVEPEIRDTIYRDICAGDTFYFYGLSCTETGSYMNLVGFANSCPRTVVLLLTVHQPEVTYLPSVNLCIGDAYIENGFEIFATHVTDTTYSFSDTTVFGCDSTVYLHVTVNEPTTGDTTAVACESFTWEGETYTVSGDYTTVKTSAAGCDSLVTLHLTINQPTTGDTMAVVCESFTWHGETYTQSGDYTSYITNVAGCDSLVTLHLIINHGTASDTSAVACESFIWKGETYTQTGDYLFLTTNIAGCDSMVTLHLTINQPTAGDTTVVACESFNWHGITYAQSGDYISYTTNAAGCDSMVVLHLTINQPTTGDTMAVACETFTWEGETYTVSGDYTTTTTNAEGCDSVVTLHLTINQPTTGDTVAVACESFTWEGETHTVSGDYSTIKTNAEGCDSVVTLHLTINQPTASDTVASACESFTWEGETYTVSGDYSTLKTNAAGCDSVVTLHLTINLPTTGDTIASACQNFTWHGETYTQSGDYTFLTTNAAGCDSLVTLHLTIHDTAFYQFSAQGCESYVWSDSVYTNSGDYIRTFTASTGCDSIVTLHLTINHATHNVEYDTACGSYQWHGSTYTQSGTYLYSYDNQSGCASVDTLHLTVHSVVTTEETASACESYVWNDSTYTQSGYYQKTFISVFGCDSIAILHLTIHHNIATSFSINACEPYSWAGEVYSASGDYIRHFTSAAGCDSAVTLHLTINQPTAGDTIAVACESFTWHGETYMQSGDYTTITTNIAGCDSVATLHLTVNHATASDTSATACESFTWEGETYTVSGDYTTIKTNSAGCDSVITLHLTVNHATASDTSVVVCESYTWNGETYTQSGDYTVYLTNAAGCDSVATLHLTFLDLSIAIVSNTLDFCDQGSAQLEVESEMSNYVWSTGATDPVITVFESGVYSVTASEGDCSATAQFTLAPCPDIYSLALPNAFTPDGDGLNDDFGLSEKFLNHVSDYSFHVYVYNRWGVLVFTSTDKHFRWNGEVDGSVFHGNVYNYVIEYRTKSGSPKNMRGSVITL
ncbi:MAG: gliding motility-associated C-terminal domain-containing protein, partial [Bacteroidales bacterium]|nr:gliding motility-associated C-terminal domain-containing protein [Bacteroidales bacterium]